MLMRITKISVKGLFGMFDHEIPLNQESRITIVHGPNGVGKTVLMEMVHGLFHEDYDRLASSPFNRLEVEFASEEIVSVEKIPNQNDCRVVYEYPIDSTRIEFLLPWASEEKSGDTRATHLDYVERLTEFATQKFIYIARKFAITLLGIKEQRQDKGNRKIPREFKHIVERTNPIFLRVARLRFPETELHRTSQNIRRSRPAALIDRLKRPFGKRSQANKRKRGTRTESGRRSTQDQYEAIINELLLYKSLEIDSSVLFRPDEGFRIIGETNIEIRPDLLSSGEQQLLIQFQQMLQAKRGTLVMIDEPELSLHVVWQRRFLELVEQITRDRDIDVIVATHSPQIIHDKWDWMVPLGEKVDD